MAEKKKLSLVYLRQLIKQLADTVGGISFSWGSITGTLSAQTDLNSALAAKVPTTRTITIDGVAYDLSANRSWTTAGGAVSSVNSQTGAVVLDTDNIAEGATNLYFTNARALAAAPAETLSSIGALIQSAGDAVPNNSDFVGTAPAGGMLKKITWTNVKAFLKTYFDTIYESLSNKDATGGYAGLTLFKINFKNAANTFTSFFTNSNTAARTYTFKDADGTIAFTSDITGTNSGTNTGDETTSTLGATINGASAATPNNTDLVATVESSVVKKITWTNVKAFLKTYFDTTYLGIAATAAAATILATARKINGVSFDGSADIMTEQWVQVSNALGGAAKSNHAIDLPKFGTSQSLTNQRVFFIPVFIPKAATITGVNWVQTVAGNYTANNNCKVGLYSYSGGTLTLVASCANDANLWTPAANTFGTKAFSSTYAASAGLYFIAILWCRSAQVTAPVLALSTQAAYNLVLNSQDFTNSALLSCYVSGTDLPATQAMSGVTTNTNCHWAQLY